MWFSLFALVLILTITFFQGLQGLFSAAITCVLTILSAALAFGLHEDIYYAWLLDRQPDHGRAIALMGIFIVSLLVFRTIFDRVITGNMKFPLYVDRAGGGVLGFVTAMTMVGMLAIGTQMLPFDSTFLGFSRYTLVDKATGEALKPPEGSTDVDRDFRATLDWSNVDRRKHAIWLSPDAFTTALISHLSANALQGVNSLSEIYPDLLEHIAAQHSGHYRESHHAVPKDALRIEAWWDMPADAFFEREEVKSDRPSQDKTVRFKRVKGDLGGGMKRIVVRANIDASAHDEDGVFRFTTLQVRLLGRERKGGPTRDYYLAGVNHEDAPQWVKLYPGEGVMRKVTGALQIDLVFEIPASTEFEPIFIEFKHNARAALRATQDQSKQPPAPLKPLPKPKKEQEGGEEGENGEPPQPQVEQSPPDGSATGTPPRTGQDRVSGIGPIRPSGYGPDLPFTLTDYGGTGVQVSGNGQLEEGNLIAVLDNNWQPQQGSRAPVSGFEVPEGMRLLQLNVEKLQPQSWIGSIYGGVSDKSPNLYLSIDGGQEQRPVGAYAMARAGGQLVCEVIYQSKEARELNYYLPGFSRIKPADLQGDYLLVYLFHLPPGARPVSLHTGRQDQDLSGENLIAPN